MTKLYLVRHGQTEWNIIGRIQGWGNSDLTQEGIDGAVLLGERLRNTDFDIAFSSPTKRAIDTTRLILRDRNVEIKEEPDLRELGYGSWDGEFLKNIRDSEEFIEYKRNPALYKAENGGETFFQLQKRTVSAINRIISEYKSENVLIVSHAVALRSIMLYFENLPIDKIWDLPPIRNTSVTLIETDGKNSKIILYGDISHLKENV